MLKLITTVLVLLLIVTNAWWFYGVVDQASIQKYVEIENRDLQMRVDALKPIAEMSVVGLTQNEAEQLLSVINPNAAVFTKEGHVNSVGVSLRLNTSGLVEGIR